jgi:hypothetical protein
MVTVQPTKGGRATVLKTTDGNPWMVRVRPTKGERAIVWKTTDGNPWIVTVRPTKGERGAKITEKAQREAEVIGLLV